MFNNKISCVTCEDIDFLIISAWPSKVVFQMQTNIVFHKCENKLLVFPFFAEILCLNVCKIAITYPYGWLYGGAVLLKLCAIET